MKGHDKRSFERLNRVVVFRQDNPQLFEAGTLAGKTIAEIQAAVDLLTEHDASVEGGSAKVRLSASERSAARDALRNWLERIARTAAGLQLELFSMPRGKSDGTFVSVGRAWSGFLEPVQSLFVDAGLPPDFIDRLNVAIGNVQRVINEQESSKGLSLGARTSIKDTLSAAQQALTRLIPIVDNLLADNPPLFAVWQRARRLERYNVAKPAAE